MDDDEKKEKMDENIEPEKKGKVIAECPVCKKKLRRDAEEMIIMTQYLVAMPPGNPPMPSMPKMTCLNCGIEFFPPQILQELKKKAQGETQIIIPQGQVRIQ
jgi:rubredoxin